MTWYFRSYRTFYLNPFHFCPILLNFDLTLSFSMSEILSEIDYTYPDTITVFKRKSNV